MNEPNLEGKVENSTEVQVKIEPATDLPETINKDLDIPTEISNPEPAESASSKVDKYVESFFFCYEFNFI